MKHLEQISGNELSELSALMGEINHKIDRDFTHVEQFLPIALRKQLEKLDKAIGEEKQRREKLYYKYI